MKAPRKNRLEWAVFGVSASLVLGLLGLLGYDAATSENEPARLVIEHGAPVQQDGSWVVPLTLRNAGDQAAAEVVVEVGRGGTKTERTTLHVSLVPRHGEHRVWALLPVSGGSPAPPEIDVRVLGYQEP